MAKPANDTYTLDGGFEMIGLIEFARRMSVSSNTVRNWMKDGKLLRGTHYFKVGHVYRFPWSQQFVMKIMEHMTPPQPTPRPKLRSHNSNRGHLKFRA